MRSFKAWPQPKALRGAPVTAYAARRERGFTLIELLVASGYFLLGISAVALFQIAAAKGSASAGDLMMATTLTANQLEAMRSTPYASLAAQGNQTLYYDRFGNKQNAAPGFFTLAYALTPTANNASYGVAAVTTTWQQSPINPFVHAVSMQTFVGSN